VTGAPLKARRGEGSVAFVRFSPDSKIISVSRREACDLLRCPSAEPIASARGQGVRAEDIVFSADSRFFVTIGTDATTDDRTKSYIKLWDSATGKELKLVPCDDTDQIVFSPDLSRCAMLMRNSGACKVVDLRK
jgi:WD40 repeat protein